MRSPARRTSAPLLAVLALSLLFAAPALALPGNGGGYGKRPKLPSCFGHQPTEAEGYQCAGITTKQAVKPTELVADNGRFTFESPYAGVDTTTPQGCGDLGCVYNHWDWQIGTPSAITVKGCQTNVATCKVRVPAGAGRSWFPIGVSLDNDPPQVFVLWRPSYGCPLPAFNRKEEIEDQQQRRAGPVVAHAANDSELAHIPVSERGVCTSLYYSASNGLHHGLSFLFGDGLKATGYYGSYLAIRGTFVGTLPDLGPGAYGASAFVAYGCNKYVIPWTSDAGDAIIAAQQAAILDPPDSHFKKLARVKAVHPRLMPRRKHVSAGARKAMNRLIVASAKASVVAKALETTIDRLGGARVANDSAWRGKQARLAQSLSKRLQKLLVQMSSSRHAAAAAARRSKYLRKPSISRKRFAALQRSVRKHGFSAKYKRFAKKVLHQSAASLKKQRAEFVAVKAKTVPLSLAAFLGAKDADTNLLVIAGGLKGYAASPSVTADAKRH